MTKDSQIPKIIHQLWIGKEPAPIHMMNTWKEKHSDYEYIFWNEEEFIKRKMIFTCQEQINMMDEINGKADIMRWEILYKMGGYFIDADSICIEPFDDYFDNKVAFATFENETLRKELVATGTMGFIPNYPLCNDIIEWIKSPDSVKMLTTVRAWGSVGPGVLTRFLKTGKYKDFSVYPSHCFLPIHFTGTTYVGHKKVYAYQAWGSTNNSYKIMNEIKLPNMLLYPKTWVSVLICSFNTCQKYLKECLESIKCQNGIFGIELVWINDGSDDEHSLLLEKELNIFERRSRFCKVVYKKLPINTGIAAALNAGLGLCGHDYIFRMDSDDIMLPDRIKKQLEFMKKNIDCVLCGTNIHIFSNLDNVSSTKQKQIISTTNHPSTITWVRLEEIYKKHGGLPTWFMNHPTLCFHKNAIIGVGNYRTDVDILEDYDLELRIIKKFGVVYNLEEPLLLYRKHREQVTQINKMNSAKIESIRAELIVELFSC